MYNQVIAVLVKRKVELKEALKACQTLGVDPVVIPWTEDLKKDIEAIRGCGADLVLVEEHGRDLVSGYGYQIAEALKEQLGVDSVILCGAVNVRTSCGFPVVIDAHFFDNWLETATLIKRGSRLLRGGFERQEEEKVRIAEKELQKARQRLKKFRKFREKALKRQLGRG